MPPPGHTATTATAAGHDRQVIDTAITSKREAIRWLRAECGVTGAQAHKLYDAYRADMERPLVTARVTYSRWYLDRLMRQAPGPRNHFKSAAQADRDYYLMEASA